MAVIAPLGKYQAFDDNGDPLSGGKLNTYEAGTTTPKATYTTAEGNVANTNPVVLDASGYADVWLGEGGYKFILTDSDDNVIFTVDNISGTSTGFASQVNTITSNTAITTSYNGSANIVTGNTTLSLLSAASAGSGFVLSVHNAGTSDVTIDPDSAELIDGDSTLVLSPNSSAIIVCDGTAWYTISGGQIRGTLRVAGSSSTAAGLSLAEDTDNGTNTMTIRAAAAIGSNFTLTYPDNDGNDGDVMQSNGSGVLSFVPRVNMSIQVFTSGGTYTAPDGLKYAIVRGVGGGGAGGGAVATTGAQLSGGSGGGAGGYSERLLTAAQIGASQTVTIGAGGTGSAGATGGAGTASSFGSLLVMNGGIGGLASAVSTTILVRAAGSAGGTATTGDVNVTGGSGSDGFGAFNSNFSCGGGGGNSLMGSGGSTRWDTVGVNGAAGTGYGGGGGGALNGVSQSARAGGNGSPGIIIVYEFK